MLLATVGIVLGIAMSGGQAKGTDTTPNEPSVPAKPALSPGWSTFKGEGFSVGLPAGVTLPEKPATQEMEVNPYMVRQKTWSTKESPNSGQNGFEVTKIQLKPDYADKFQTDPTSAWVELFKADSSHFTPVTGQSGVQVRERKFNRGPTKLTIRVLVKGDTLFVLEFASRDIDGNDPNVKPFFDTFKID